MVGVYSSPTMHIQSANISQSGYDTIGIFLFLDSNKCMTIDLLANILMYVAPAKQFHHYPLLHYC